jgi:hypothetical protein
MKNMKNWKTFESKTDEFIIVNKTNILKRIEDLVILDQELNLIERKYRDKDWDEKLQSYNDEILILKQILSQSTPLDSNGKNM